MPLIYYRKPPGDTSKVVTLPPQGGGTHHDDLASVHEGLIEQHIPESFSPIATLGLAFRCEGRSPASSHF